MSNMQGIVYKTFLIRWVKMNDNTTNIFGGEIRGTYVVIGSGSKADIRHDDNQVTDPELSNVLKNLNYVKEILLANKTSICNVEELLDSVSVVDREIRKGNPNGTLIKNRLNKLASSVSSVATLVNAVAALEAAVKLLLR